MLCFHMNLLRLLQLTFRLIQVRQAQSRFRSRESSVQAASKTKEEQFPRITFHKKPLRVLNLNEREVSIWETTRCNFPIETSESLRFFKFAVDLRIAPLSRILGAGDKPY